MERGRKIGGEEGEGEGEGVEKRERGKGRIRWREEEEGEKEEYVFLNLLFFVINSIFKTQIPSTIKIPNPISKIQIPSLK